MTIYQRPDEKVFAQNALPGELQEFPDILRGWGITFEQTDGFPPMEWFNALAKRQDEAIRYMIQQGIPEWSASEQYPTGAYVKHGARTWRSKTANTNKQPDTNPEDWVEWGFDRAALEGKLGKTETAADSAKLGGQLPGYYAAVLDAVPPGFVGSFAMASAPAGWLKANGAVVSRAAYSRLFSVIGTTFGTGDGSTTFNLPDLRGEFVRGWDDRRGVDNGRVFGSAQADALQGHGHELLYPYTGANGGDLGAAVQTSVAAQVLRNRATAITDLASFGAARASSETRGRNVALLACIKY